MSERDSSPPVHPGDVLAGKYRVERVLGAGGMGVVVQAKHLELEERVALKFLLPHAVESPEAAARFVREARAAVRIKSEHVARVSDVGRLENGSPYIVMEYLEGADLAVALQSNPIAVEEAIDYVIQACDAMAEAHAAGIVHRDLKPSNLFLTRRSDGTPIIKVLDFGISKLNVPDTSDAGLTKTQTLMGSPFYMSPEQMRSAREVDHRTDVWSLGVILHELLSGTQPFNGETLPQLLAAILSEPPLPLAPRRPDLPPGLEAVIQRALEKDRARRFQSVGELAQALVPFAPRRSRYTVERIFRLSGLDAPASASSVPAPALSGLSTTAGVAARTGEPAWSPGRRTARSLRSAWVVGGALLLIAAGGAAFFAFGGSQADAELAEQTLPAAAEPPPSGAAPRVEPVAEPAPAERPVAPPVASAAAAAPAKDAARPSTRRSEPARPKPQKAAVPAPAPAPAPAPPPPAPPKKNPLAIELK